MSTLIEEPAIDKASSAEGEDFDYKALSRAAVISVIFGLIGFMAWESPYLIVLPLLAVVLALSGLSAIRRFQEELTGKNIALAGLSLGSIMMVVAPVKHTYVYLTEVPDGYERVSFGVLKS
ncbi:MAG: hypothetical protein ACK5N9_21285, partial [Pirellula sp.]